MTAPTNGIQRQVPQANFDQTDAVGSSSEVGISTDYAIEFARVRGSQIDSWLNRQLQQMETGAAESQSLNDVLAELTKYPDGIGSKDPNGVFNQPDQGTMDKLKATIQDAIDKLPPDSPVRAQLQDLKDKATSTLNQGANGGTDSCVTANEIATITTTLKNSLTDVDHQSQDAQLMVNQKLGEKSEVMQLAAMLIQQENDTAKSIIQRQ